LFVLGFADSFLGFAEQIVLHDDVGGLTARRSHLVNARTHH